MKSHRLLRAIDPAIWAFALTLAVTSIWGFWHSLSRIQQTLEHYSFTHRYLNQLESALVEMERSLLGLVHADSRKARFVGYEPEVLWSDLKRGYRKADAATGDILASLARTNDPSLKQSLIRIEREWAEIRSRLIEYLEAESRGSINLSTLRTFTFRGQDTLDNAVRDFKSLYQVHQENMIRSSLYTLAGYLVMICVSFGLLGWIAWRRWVFPLRWLRRVSTQPEAFPACLHGTDWETIYQRLMYQEQRLRTVEVFMRDLAMGRTPKPIQPTSASDSLARSSTWLLKRMEQLNSQRREAV
ncbi:MAG: hypothetical protein N2651_10795 [Fimbriimonadales bacterium]|nr:hypothetical protein [Fimbriimonadales bacterium]